MEKKVHLLLTAVLLILGLSLRSQLFAQTAQFQFFLIVTDNAGGSQRLDLGVDPLGTDTIDASIGEIERFPIPFTGTFDARFVGDDIGIPAMGLGLIQDFRQGTVSFSGNRIHELKYQVGEGTTITISWNLPTWAAGRLQDIVLGTIIDSTMHGSGSYTVASPGVFNKLKLTITYTAPLPVQLVSFVGRVANQQGHVKLDWRTLTETNNYGFFVQKSLNNEDNYQTISELIPGHGTTIEPHDYTWTDVNATSGRWYYRLKQVDLDGSVNYSEGIIPAGLTGVKEKPFPTEYALSQNFPNPFNPSTKIEYAMPKQGDVKLEVYNLIGQRVATLVNGVQPAGYHTVEFNASGFSSGLYFYRLTAGSNTSIMKKMVLTK